MNLGYDGNDIFAGNKKKAQFLEFLEGTAKAGLKYSEIAGIEIFADLSFASLRSIYRNMKRKKKYEED